MRQQPPIRGRGSKSNRAATPKLTARAAAPPPPTAAAARRRAVATAAAGAAAAALGLFLLGSPETAAQAVDVGDVGGRRGAAETGGTGAGLRERGGGSPEAFDTVLMVDAGSSGSRLNVYRLDREVREPRRGGGWVCLYPRRGGCVVVDASRFLLLWFLSKRKSCGQRNLS